jgi:nucleoside-diphosphate-sugar epimerase
MGSSGGHTVAIVGGSGFVGRHLLARLVSRHDIRIRALRHEGRLPGDVLERGAELVEGDLFRPASLERLLVPGCTVVNLAYVSGYDRGLEAMDNLGKACVSAGVRRMIHCSTAVVAGRVTETEVSEKTVCRPFKEYEVTKLAIEQLLVDRYGDRLEVIILRPTAVFGPGGRNLLKLMDNLTDGRRWLNYLRSCLSKHRRMNLVCVDNVVGALVWSIGHDKPVREPEVFIVSDDEDPVNDYRSVEAELMRLLGQRPYIFPVVPVPLTLLSILLRGMGRSNYNPSTVYSCRKLMESGFEKSVSVREGLADLARWYRCSRTDGGDR